MDAADTPSRPRGGRTRQMMPPAAAHAARGGGSRRRGLPALPPASFGSTMRSTLSVGHDGIEILGNRRDARAYLTTSAA